MLVRVPHYSNWSTFSRTLLDASESPRVIVYINIHIFSLCFSLWNDILNYRDLSCIFFFNQSSSYFLINIYSDLSQLALKYLKNTEVNINNDLTMTRNLNIRNSFWNPNFPYYSTYRDTLFDTADSFQLEISKPTKFFLIRYSNNNQDSNSVLDLIFLHLFSTEFDNYYIYPDWRLTSNYAPITVNILIFDECIPTKKWFLIKNSDEENYFIEELANIIKWIDIFSSQSIEALENIIQMLATNINSTWLKYSKNVNITKYSKIW